MDVKWDTRMLLEDYSRQPTDGDRNLNNTKLFLTDLHLKSSAMLGKSPTMESVVALQTDPDVMASPPRPRIEMARVTPVEYLIELIPYAESVFNGYSKYWHDASLFNCRRCRVSWTPLTFVTADSDISQNGITPNTDENVHLSTFNAAVRSFLRIDKESQSHDLKALLACQLDSSLTAADGIGFVPSNNGPAIIEHYKTAGETLENQPLFCSVVELCDALWGYSENSREEMLTRWLIKQFRGIVDAEVRKFKRKGEQHYIDAVFSLITSLRLSEAGALAQSIGDWRLSLLIGQMLHNNPESIALCSKQLIQWFEVQADRHIDTTRMKIYVLAAGLLSWKCSDGRLISVCENLDWKRTFAVYYWYSCRISNISVALERYDENWRNTSTNSALSITQPLPAYMEEDPQIAEQCRIFKSEQPNEAVSLDICYHLLKLYNDRSYSIHKLLESSTWTADPFSFQLSWHLWCILKALDLIHVESCILDILHSQYANQLERQGLWHWGIFVALYMEYSHQREALIKRILSQYAWRCSNDEQSFLLDRLSIPKEWFVEQKALRCKALGDSLSEMEHLLDAGYYNLAHNRFLEFVGPYCVVNGDERLNKFLSVLDAHSYEVADWAIGGEIFTNYVNASDKMEKYVELLRCNEDASSLLNALRPLLLILGKRLTLLDCRSNLQKLCQGEMSVRIARYCRILLEPYQFDGIAEVFRNLPMPDDYVLEEIQHLSERLLSHVR